MRPPKWDANVRIGPLGRTAERKRAGAKSGLLSRGRKSMRMLRPTPKHRAALLACAGLLAASPAAAQQGGPLVLAKSSYFFIGGKIDSNVQGSPPVGHM